MKWIVNSIPFASIGVACFMAIGYCVAYAALHGTPTFQPVEAADWPPFAVIGGMIVGLVASVVAVRRAVSLSIRLIISILGVYLFFRLIPAETRPAVWVRIATGAIVWLFWIDLDRLAESVRPAVFWPSIAAASAGLSITLALSGSLVLGVLTAIITCLSVIVMIISFFKANLADASASVPTIAAATVLLALSGMYFADLLVGCVALSTISAQAAWITRVPGINRLSTWKQVLITCAIAIGFAAGSAFVAYRAYPIEADSANDEVDRRAIAADRFV